MLETRAKGRFLWAESDSRERSGSIAAVSNSAHKNAVLIDMETFWYQLKFLCDALIALSKQLDDEAATSFIQIQTQTLLIGLTAIYKEESNRSRH